MFMAVGATFANLLVKWWGCISIMVETVMLCFMTKFSNLEIKNLCLSFSFIVIEMSIN